MGKAQTRWISRALALVILCAVFAPFALGFVFMGHDCTGSDCIICSIISGRFAFLKTWAAVITGIAVVAANFAGILRRAGISLSVARTPVLARVRMND